MQPNFIQNDPNIVRRRRLAESLVQQGTSAAPVQHWLQGAARLAQALSGKSQLESIEKDINDRGQRYQDTLKDAFEAYQGTPEGVTPFVPDTFDESDPILQNQGLKDIVPAQPGGIDAMAKVLAGNADTASLGLDFKFKDIENKRLEDQYQRRRKDKLQDQLTLAQFKSLSGLDTPSAVREYEYYKKLPKSQQDEFLTVKRANKVIDRGGSFQTLGQATNSPLAEVEKTLKPEDRPENAKAKAEAAAIGSAEGRAAGEAKASLADLEASLPRLEEITTKLSDLGKKATFTKAGQARDALQRELGGEVSDEAVARAEYIATVDNEVLPLLRQTFGAAFTEKEGQSLKATLGDPNKSPKEKDAVLRAFIETKRAQVETMRRRAGSNKATISNKADALVNKYLGDNNGN